MNTKAGLYAVTGGIVGAALTMAVGHVMPIGAQNGDASFGEITCTGLKVVDAEGTSRVSLSADEDTGGWVKVGVKGEAQRVFLFASEYGAAVSVKGKVGKVSLSSAGRGSGLEVKGKVGNVELSALEDGGVVSVTKGDEPRVSISVDSLGNGEVSTWDKNGDLLATLGR